MSLSEVLRSRVAELETRRAELEAAVSDPERARQADFPTLLRELGALGKTLDPWRRFLRLEEEIREARSLAEGDDPEMAALAREEVAGLEEESQRLEERILDRVLDAEGDADRSAIVEIRAGTGGDEAALFVGDLFRIYAKLADSRGWAIEVLDSSEGEAGGFKEIVFRASGEGPFGAFRFESGVHRVQRVPATESQGRIHTSAATVAVLPEVEEREFHLNMEDLEISAMRAGGPGGQHVNKTSSAIRVVHKPTGIAIRCQEDKSQHRNRAKALDLLRARLFEIERREKEASRAQARRGQVGSGDRSERVRTYNWPQNRVTDHRVGLSFSLETILEGRLDPLIEALQKADREARLAEL